MGYEKTTNQSNTKEGNDGMDWVFQATRAYWLIRVFTARQMVISGKLRRIPPRYAKFDGYSDREVLELIEKALTWNNPYLENLRETHQAENLPRLLRLPAPSGTAGRFSWAGNDGNRELLRDGGLQDERSQGLSYGEREISA